MLYYFPLSIINSSEKQIVVVKGVAYFAFLMKFVYICFQIRLPKITRLVFCAYASLIASVDKVETATYDIVKGHHVPNHTSPFSARSSLECAAKCSSSSPPCVGFNFQKASGWCALVVQAQVPVEEDGWDFGSRGIKILCQKDFSQCAYFLGYTRVRCFFLKLPSLFCCPMYVSQLPSFSIFKYFRPAALPVECFFVSLVSV